MSFSKKAPASWQIIIKVFVSGCSQQTNRLRKKNVSLLAIFVKI
jgi:hypothetical protein